MKAAHKCTPSLTPDEEREAVVLLKKACNLNQYRTGYHTSEEQLSLLAFYNVA